MEEEASILGIRNSMQHGQMEMKLERNWKNEVKR